MKTRKMKKKDRGKEREKRKKRKEKSKKINFFKLKNVPQLLFITNG